MSDVLAAWRRHWQAIMDKMIGDGFWPGMVIERAMNVDGLCEERSRFATPGQIEASRAGS